MSIPTWGVNVEQKPVGLAEMAHVVAAVAGDYFDLDAARVAEGRQVFPAPEIDRRVYVLERAAKLLDLLRGTPELVAAVQKAARAKREEGMKKDTVP